MKNYSKLLEVSNDLDNIKLSLEETEFPPEFDKYFEIVRIQQVKKEINDIGSASTEN